MPRETLVAVGFRPPRPRLSGVPDEMVSVVGILAFREGSRPQPGTTPGFTFWAGMTLPAGGD